MLEPFLQDVEATFLPYGGWQPRLEDQPYPSQAAKVFPEKIWFSMLQCWIIIT